MRPLVTCQKPAFRKLIIGLSGVSDTSLLPDTKVMSKELKLRYASYVNMLTDLMSKVNFICIMTADIWSCNTKSYLGMTCHFFDENNNYSRHSFVMGCRRIKGSHTFINIAHVTVEIINTYKVNNSKISHIVTDNAFNFGKAFRTFSSTSTNKIQSSSSSLSNWFSSSNSSDDESNTVKSNSDSDNGVKISDISNIFSPSENTTNNNDDDGDDISLPEHLTCATHTLSLIATSDNAKISDPHNNKNFKSVFDKLNAFWKLLSRNTVAILIK